MKKITLILIFILVLTSGLVLPQAVLAADPVARDISSKVIKDTQHSTLNLIKLQASDADTGDALTYAILSLPVHGQLKDEAEQAIATVPYALSSNKLKYLPASGFTGTDSFTYKANDVSSDSNTATASLNITEWFAPIGIPEPEFGIKETYRMYDDPAKRNPALTYTQNAEGGYYTHYIDNTHPQATDTGNTYGTQDRPRRTVSSDLVEGSVVEIHGGPYNYGTPSGGYGWRWFSGIGTSEKPIFIRGLAEEMPVFIKVYIRIGGSYLVIENLKLQDSKLNFHDDYLPHVYDHISMRGLEIYGFLRSSGSLIAYGSPTYTIHDIVVYNNHIYSNGNVLDGQDTDVIGVMVGEKVEKTWIVDNHIHHNDGDSVQLNAAGGDWAQNNEWPKYVYIGRDIMHEDRENAVDLKDCEHVIISENAAYGYNTRDRVFGVIPTPRPIHSGLPTAIIAANEGTRRTWTIFNDIYDCGGAIRVSDEYVNTLQYIIGNKIYNIEGNAIQSWRDTELYIINNDIYNVGRGFWGAETGNSDTAYYVFINNIFSKMNGYAVDDLLRPDDYISVERDPPADRAVVSNNLFYQGGGFTWGDSDADIYNSLADFIARETGKGQGCLEIDPLFVDSVNNDFHLQAASPAINAGTSSGIVQEVFDTFHSLYGIDIRKDIEGNARPQGSGWDIGAYEFTPSSGNVIYGDVSGDSEISAYDAALTAQAAVGLINLTAEQAQAADVSGDAEVSAYDAALIAQRAVGLIEKFPVEG